MIHNADSYFGGSLLKTLWSKNMGGVEARIAGQSVSGSLPRVYPPQNLEPQAKNPFCRKEKNLLQNALSVGALTPRVVLQSKHALPAQVR